MVEMGTRAGRWGKLGHGRGDGEHMRVGRGGKKGG